MNNTNTIKRTTYKIVGDFIICNKVRTCLILLSQNKKEANRKLKMILKNKETYIPGEIIGEPYILVEEEDGTEWYYSLTD